MQCEMSLSWTKASNHFVAIVPSLPEEKGGIPPSRRTPGGLHGGRRCKNPLLCFRRSRSGSPLLHRKRRYGRCRSLALRVRNGVFAVRTLSGSARTASLELFRAARCRAHRGTKAVRSLRSKTGGGWASRLFCTCCRGRWQWDRRRQAPVRDHWSGPVLSPCPMVWQALHRLWTSRCPSLIASGRASRAHVLAVGERKSRGPGPHWRTRAWPCGLSIHSHGSLLVV